MKTVQIFSMEISVVLVIKIVRDVKFLIDFSGEN